MMITADKHLKDEKNNLSFNKRLDDDNVSHHYLVFYFLFLCIMGPFDICV